MGQPLPPIISRKDAHERGLRFFFTGEPCVHGHMAQRYTSTNGCVECLRRFKPRLNPLSKDKVPYAPNKPLWRTKRHTAETLDELYKYLQVCIDHFELQRFPPVCKECNGTHYVPMLPSEPEYAPGKWKWCVACEEKQPSTADVVPTGTEAEA